MTPTFTDEELADAWRFAQAAGEAANAIGNAAAEMREMTVTLPAKVIEFIELLAELPEDERVGAEHSFSGFIEGAIVPQLQQVIAHKCLPLLLSPMADPQARVRAAQQVCIQLNIWAAHQHIILNALTDVADLEALIEQANTITAHSRSTAYQMLTAHPHLISQADRALMMWATDTPPDSPPSEAE